MSTDYRDIAIEALTDTEAELRARIVHLRADITAYCELAHAAIHALHALTAERDRLRTSHRRLLDAHRELRQRTGGRADQEAA